MKHRSADPDHPKTIGEVDSTYQEGRLLEKMALGDHQAFRTLHDHYWNDIFYISLSFLKSPQWAQDIVQDVFLKLWEKRQSLPEIETFRSYLFTMTRNHLINALRARMRREAVVQQYRQQLPDDWVLADNGIVKETENQIATALAQLPEQQRLIFNMTRNEGRSHEDIARQLGITRKTVANNMTRTLNFLRQYLSDHGDELAMLFFTVLAWALEKNQK